MQVEGNPHALAKLWSLFREVAGLVDATMTEGASSEADTAYLDNEYIRVFGIIDRHLIHYPDRTAYVNVKITKGDQQYQVHMEIKPAE